MEEGAEGPAVMEGRECVGLRCSGGSVERRWRLEWRDGGVRRAALERSGGCWAALERSGGRLFSKRSRVAAALGGSSVRSVEMCLPPVAEAVPSMPPVAEAVPGAPPAPQRKRPS